MQNSKELMGTIRLATLADSRKMLEIYAYYVAETAITFDLVLPDVVEFEAKIEKIQKKYCWLVFESEGDILGYAYGAEHRPKRAYQWTVESTVYVDNSKKSKGVGNVLYRALLYTLDKQGFSKILAGITLPNKSSENFHKKFGFKQFARFEAVGFKHNKWHDTDWWELALNVGDKPKELITIESIVEQQGWKDFVKDVVKYPTKV